MGRGQFSPLEFGTDLMRETLMDLMVEDLGTYDKGQWTMDELLLHPREGEVPLILAGRKPAL
jgi:hypothetical protein